MGMSMNEEELYRCIIFFITALTTNGYLLLRNMILGIIGSFGPEKEPDPGFELVWHLGP